MRVFAEPNMLICTCLWVLLDAYFKNWYISSVKKSLDKHNDEHLALQLQMMMAESIVMCMCSMNIAFQWSADTLWQLILPEFLNIALQFQMMTKSVLSCVCVQWTLHSSDRLTPGGWHLVTINFTRVPYQLVKMEDDEDSRDHNKHDRQLITSANVVKIGLSAHLRVLLECVVDGKEVFY